MRRILLIFLLAVIYPGTGARTLAEEADANKPATDAREQQTDSTPAPKEKKYYVYYDKNGKPVYTDTPPKGAQEVIIQKDTEYSPPEIDHTWDNAKPKVVEGPVYSHFEIISPVQDETIRDNMGNIQVAVDIRPKLLAGHSVSLLMDGQAVSSQTSGFFSLSNVDRGTHVFTAEIKGKDDKVLITSNPVTIHLHRASVH